MQKRKGQQQFDSERVYLGLTFPNDVTEKQIESFIRSIGANLVGGSTWTGVPSMDFEVWAFEGVITHRMRVPTNQVDYLKNQLHRAIPGTEIEDLGAPEHIKFHYGVTIHMKNPSEEMTIKDIGDFTNKVLSPFQSANQQGDVLVLQWVITNSHEQKVLPADQPIKSNRSSWLSQALSGTKFASHDEVAARRAKQQEQNYVAVGRIAASGRGQHRASGLVNQISQALTSQGGSAHLYTQPTNAAAVSTDIQLGRTPLRMTAQFSVKELVAVTGWPTGSTLFQGLKRSSSLQMFPPESVPRDGVVIGFSMMNGVERPVAMTYEAGLTHTYIAGGTGVGKTTELKNMGKRHLEAGAGMILLEREGNLFQGMLDLVPPHRMKDVICIDFSNTDQPVGLNILRGRKPEVVAGQFAALLEALYPDKNSMYAEQLVLHGIPVLANLERATIADLIPLAHPRNPAEKAWAKAAVARAGKTYRDYFDDWFSKDEKFIATNSQPLKNRMYAIMTPDPIRYLLNQETSSFDPLDVINGNKILLINLAGPSEKAASLIGNMITAAIWDAAKRCNPTKPNFLYLDEFQQFSHLSADFEDMLATARKRKLGLVMATQYIERLSRSLQDAVMANARTKIIFQSSSGSSQIHATDFASNHVRKEAFMNLKAYQALARINTAVGISPPVTMSTYPDPEPYGYGQQILRMSEETYGRNIADIDHDDLTRRILTSSPTTTKRKDIGRSSYDVAAIDFNQ